MRRKAQAAMEFLMTYGWAILAIIVVVAALYGMGVFTRRGTVPCSPCFSYFAYVDHSGTQLVVRNGAREISSISSWEGTPSATSAQPGATITISGATIGDEESAWVQYTVTESGLARNDTATLHAV